MTIPTYDTCIEPLLRLLAKHPDGIRTTEVYEKLADHFQLTEDERAELLPSGTQAVYHNRIGWAHDRIKRKGLSSSPRRGLWKATEAGVQFIANHPSISQCRKYRQLPDSSLTRATHETPTKETHVNPRRTMQ